MKVKQLFYHKNALFYAFWTTLIIYVVLFLLYMADAYTGIQPFAKDGITVWKNIGNTEEYKEFNPYRELKTSSYILLSLWILFYAISFILYIALCFTTWKEEHSDKLTTFFIKATIGYFPFICLPLLSLFSLNSTTMFVLLSIGMFNVQVLGSIDGD